MTLWGNKDTVYSTGNVNVNVTTGVVSKQSGSIAWTAGNGVKVGPVSYTHLTLPTMELV